MEAGFQPRGSGVASPPQLHTKILEATKRVWSRGSPARAKMAGKIQRRWPRVLGWQSIRQRIFHRDPAGGTNLRGNVGIGSVPAPLSTGAGYFVRPDLDARVAPDRGAAEYLDGARPELETAVSRGASVVGCVRPALASRHSEQSARAIS